MLRSQRNEKQVGLSRHRKTQRNAPAVHHSATTMWWLPESESTIQYYEIERKSRPQSIRNLRYPPRRLEHAHGPRHNDRQGRSINTPAREKATDVNPRDQWWWWTKPPSQAVPATRLGSWPRGCRTHLLLHTCLMTSSEDEQCATNVHVHWSVTIAASLNMQPDISRSAYYAAVLWKTRLWLI